MHGKWIEEYTLDTIQYKSIGRYKEGEPVKKWKYYANGKIIKKETYKKEYCKVRFYHPNGALQAKGITKLIEKEKEKGLTHIEKDELDHYLVLERLIRLAKAHARQRLAVR